MSRETEPIECEYRALMGNRPKCTKDTGYVMRFFDHNKSEEAPDCAATCPLRETPELVEG